MVTAEFVSKKKKKAQHACDAQNYIKWACILGNYLQVWRNGTKRYMLPGGPAVFSLDDDPYKCITSIHQKKQKKTKRE